MIEPANLLSRILRRDRYAGNPKFIGTETASFENNLWYDQYLNPKRIPCQEKNKFVCFLLALLICIFYPLNSIGFVFCAYKRRKV
jgi:hypothetical protein